MELDTLQRRLLALITGRSATDRPADPYLDRVAQSPELRLIQEIIMLWRGYDLLRTCPLTTELLRQQARFEAAIQAFARRQPHSAFVETLSERFLADLSEDADPLVAAVARFEAALQAARRGAAEPVIIEWPVEPYGVLHALLTHQPAAVGAVPGRYWTDVGAAIPQHFRVSTVAAGAVRPMAPRAPNRASFMNENRPRDTSMPQ